MLVSRPLAWMCPAIVMLIGVGAVCAQNYPSQTIRIVTGGPSGALDLSARLLAQGIAAGLGQQPIIENRISAGGALAVQAVIKARPDGYTLLLYGSNIWLFQFMADNVPWDTIRDLAPITLVVKSPSVLLVHPTLPVKSVEALIAPANTPAAIINRLNQETVRFLTMPETKERFLNAGLETAGGPPEQLLATIKSDMAKWGKLIKDAGIRE